MAQSSLATWRAGTCSRPSFARVAAAVARLLQPRHCHRAVWIADTLEEEEGEREEEEEQEEEEQEQEQQEEEQEQEEDDDD